MFIGTSRVSGSKTVCLSRRKPVWTALAAMMIIAGSGWVGALSTAVGATVIYDMQTDANLAAARTGADHGLIRYNATAAGGATYTVNTSGGGNNSISVTGRTANTQGVAVSIGWIKDHLAANTGPDIESYVLTVTGTLGTASQTSRMLLLRARVEGWTAAGTDVTTDYAVGEGGAFQAVRTLSIDDLNGYTNNAAIWITTNSTAGNSLPIVITGLTIEAVPPASETQEITIFDMQTDPVFPSIGRGNVGGGTGARDHHPMFFVNVGGDAHSEANASGAIIGTQPNLAFGMANTNGTSQGLMINIAALGIKVNHSVRFEIVGTHSGTGTARFRTENGITPQRTFGDVAITDNAFTISHTVPYATLAADITQAAAGRYGINLPTGTHTITTLRIIAICPPGCDDCEPDLPLVTPFTWGAPGGPALHSATNATANRGGDVSYITHVIRTGEPNINPSVLRFSNPIITDEDKDVIREAGNSMFTLSPSSTANRVLHVWTDLSADVPGAAGNVDSLNFITTANQTAGAIIGPIGNLDPIEINIPIHLLYLPPAGGQPEKFASAIYVLTTLGSTNLTATITDPPAANADGRFRVDVTNAISHAVLTIVPPLPFATNISLNYGINASEMRFTWWTPKGEATASVIQLVPAASLVGGQMPANPTTFNGVAPVPIPSSLPAYDFDVNRVIATGLLPNTEYAYRVGDGTANNWSAIHTFLTFNPNTEHIAIVVSDPQISSGAVTRMRNAWSHSLTSAVARADGLGGASLMISAGDNTAYANDVVEIDAYLFPPELRSLPVFTTVGNHDAVDQRGGAGYQPNLALLPLVYNWPNHNWLNGSPTSTDNQRRGGGNHYFSHGNTLYISLNTNITHTTASLNAHRAFIQEAVASHPDATWKVATFHHDIFGSGSGHSAGMVGSGRQALGAVLNEFGIDFVINGHDHTHGRSLFMDSTTVVQNQRPVDFARNMDKKLVFDPHPGTFVAPDGIVYMTLGSPADFPKYTSVVPHHPWVAYTDPEEYDDFAQYSIMRIDGNSLTFETWVIPYNTSTRLPSGAPEVMHSSITLRKNATHSDLQQLITGAEALPQGDITGTTWNAFQAAITSAKAVASSAAPTAIHNAFMGIYDRYYELETTTNKDLLAALVKEVADTLAVAVEGLWAGQYPAGTIAVLRVVFEPAAEVNALPLSTQEEIDAQYALLRAAFDTFLAGASDIPRPWIDIHQIPATGTYTMGLVDWMTDTLRLNPHWNHINYWDRFFAHNTKYSFAGGTFGQNYTTFAENSAPGGPRTENRFAPANATGGRRPGVSQAASHITRTHVGEWIRYELNVAQAGEYRVELGAINPRNAEMVVLLRDLNYNTLTSFSIPANHGTAGEWETAPMIPASGNIYLPAGNFIIEMVFMNDGVSAVHNGSGIPSTYTNGPNVDILTFERVGAGTPPTWSRPNTVFILPLPTNDAAGNVLRQRGWGTNGVSGEWGTITGSPLTASLISSTTHIVFEVAARPTGNVDVVLAGNAPGLGDWNQQTYSTTGASTTGHNAVYNAVSGTYTIDLQLHPAYDLWRTTQIGRIIVSHNSDGWDELNVITAYLMLDTPVSISETDREIPTGGEDVAVIIPPITILSGEFTAGPNPVERSSGAVNFFWQGKRINDGALTIYDASGNVINRVNIVDGADAANPRRVVGSWDLTDSRGRTVSTGTYLIHGVLTAIDGKRERVSVVVGVR
ncbi:MAG: fibronectin type III domain-containing protein [Chitinispirillales bacterium]|jgi:hypothetical protein|nr:fibronectin type III domain-containing protein [Chitinispirillales bacterium]